jgi:formylmethanofuran dehydrogenase subunit E
MCLPDGVGILSCSGGKRDIVVHRGGKFALLVNKNTHVFAREEVAMLNCLLVNMIVCSRGRGKFVL